MKDKIDAHLYEKLYSLIWDKIELINKIRIKTKLPTEYDVEDFEINQDRFWVKTEGSYCCGEYNYEYFHVNFSDINKPLSYFENLFEKEYQDTVKKVKDKEKALVEENKRLKVITEKATLKRLTEKYKT